MVAESYVEKPLPNKNASESQTSRRSSLLSSLSSSTTPRRPPELQKGTSPSPRTTIGQKGHPPTIAVPESPVDNRRGSHFLKQVINAKRASALIQGMTGLGQLSGVKENEVVKTESPIIPATPTHAALPYLTAHANTSPALPVVPPTPSTPLNPPHASHRRGSAGSMLQKGNLFLGEELMQVPIFQTCSSTLMHAITAVAETQAFGPGTVILEEGTPGNCLILVMRGTLNVFVEGSKVQRLINGEYFGETILLGIEDHWKGTLKAETSCTICEIVREDFMNALEAFPTEKSYFENLRMKNRNVEYLWAGTLEYTVELFKGLSERLRRRIDQQLVRRIYFPTEKIITEGLPGDELYMLVRGKASIEIAGRIVRIERRDSAANLDTSEPSSRTKTPLLERSVTRSDTNDFFDPRTLGRAASASPNSVPSKTLSMQSGLSISDSDDRGDHLQTTISLTPVCFGELGLLGMQSVRSATVVAQTICQVRVLYRVLFLQCLEEHGESLQSMATFFEKRYNTDMKVNTQKLSEVAIFKEVGCSEDFLNFLAQNLEDRMYLEGQKIIDENLPDDRCMYLITSGKVHVLKDGQQCAVLGAGSVVGEITVLGLASKRSSTVIAAETCYTQVLHQTIVVRGLELFPDERQKVLMMAFKGAGIDDEDLPDGGYDVSNPSPLNRKYTHRAFMKVLKASPLFASTSPEFVEEISNAAIDRIYMPGDLIIEQGLKGDSMFIMVSGQAGVFVGDPESVQNIDQPDIERTHMEEVNKESQGNKMKDWDRCRMSRVGTLHAGSISGELAMLGVSTIRSATIEAETICSMWEITQEKALGILDRFPDAQKHFSQLIVKHLERTVPARVLSLQIFKAFDRKFRTLLGLYCERAVLFPGQAIAREGQAGQELFVINMGKASLEKKGIQIKTYSSGNHFGSTVMLGIHKVYLGTLTVVQTCHLLVITKSSYIQALDHYPSAHAANELKRNEKMAAEELKEAIQRISARKLIWKRYQGMINPEAQDSSEKTMTTHEMLQRSFQGWKRSTVLFRQQRRRRDRERAQYRQMMENWVKKKKEAVDRVKEKKENNRGRWDDSDLPSWMTKSITRPDRPASMPREPEVKKQANAVTPDSAQLVELLKEWPTPRPSPFYNLRVWDVLAENLEAPGRATPLLPLLTGSPRPPSTAETNPINSEPLGASPIAPKRHFSVASNVAGSLHIEKNQDDSVSGLGSDNSSSENGEPIANSISMITRPDRTIRRAVGSFAHLDCDDELLPESPKQMEKRKTLDRLMTRKSTSELHKRKTLGPESEYFKPRSAEVVDRKSVCTSSLSQASHEAAVAKAQALEGEVQASKIHRILKRSTTFA